MNSNGWKRAITIAGGALAAAVLSGAAMAQYAWIGDNGVRQYSDRPPPSSVPSHRILKAPGRAAPPAGDTAGHAADPASNPAQAPDSAQPAAPTLAQRNAEFQKRRIEQAEKAEKAAEQEKLAAERKRACEQARAYQRTLESGARIARTGADGERAFLSDNERSQEAAHTRRFLAQCA